MGCDIHAHLEIKVEEKWIYYGNPRIPRNYELFSIMAGVRGNEKPIAKIRGIPEDANITTALHFINWGQDAHSASWLSSVEISEKLIGEFNKTSESFEYEFFGYLFGNGWSLEYRNEWPEFLQDYRLIFWFDN